MAGDLRIFKYLLGREFGPLFTTGTMGIDELHELHSTYLPSRYENTQYETADQGHSTNPPSIQTDETALAAEKKKNLYKPSLILEVSAPTLRGVGSGWAWARVLFVVHYHFLDDLFASSSGR